MNHQDSHYRRGTRGSRSPLRTRLRRAAPRSAILDRDDVSEEAGHRFNSASPCAAEPKTETVHDKGASSIHTYSCVGYRTDGAAPSCSLVFMLAYQERAQWFLTTCRKTCGSMALQPLLSTRK